MLETAVVATPVGAAVVAVVDDDVWVLPDESNTISANTIYSLQTARFGWLFREFGFALRQCELIQVLETVVTTEVEMVFTFGSAITDVTVSTVSCMADGTQKAADGNEINVDE